MVIRRLILLTLFIPVTFFNIRNASCQNVVFPSNTGVIDITQPPYNADNTGEEDVTSIIQDAVDSVLPGYYRLIYFPEGTYKVSGQIAWGTDAWNQGPVFIGQDRDKTIIRLADNAEGFGEGQRKGVIYTGNGSADNFNSGIRNLTINTGSNNPGACGIQYMANNEGLMDNVTITSDDGEGKYGLDMGFTDMIGPLLVRNVLIEGFETGVQIEHAVNSMTLSNITVTGQKRYGVYIDNQVVSIEGLHSINTVPAVNVYRGSLTLVNSTLTGGSADQSAIINGFGGYMYVRNTVTSGYMRGITNFGGNGKGVDSSYIDEFVSHDALKLFPDSPDTSLNLEIKQPPMVTWESDTAKWVNIEDFGAVAGDNQDDTQAIQAAIDACTAENGKNTVVLPNRTIPANGGAKPFTIDDTLYLNENVEHVVGGAAYIEGNGQLVIQDSRYPAVKIENLRRLRGSEFGIRHESSSTVVVEASVLDRVDGRGSGNLFINDVVCNYLVLDNPVQKTWCRQLNMEGILGQNDRISNNGSELWILGYKTEQNGIKVHTFNGGKTEMMGYFNYPINSEKLSPIFIVEDASFSLTGMRQSTGVVYEDYVMEIRDGDTLVLKLQDTYNRRIPLFTGYKGDGPSYYSINATAGTGGNITPSGDVHVEPGDDQAFTITPDEGYEISQVLVDGLYEGTTDQYVFTGVIDDHTISVDFSLIPNSLEPEGTCSPKIYPNPAESMLNVDADDAGTRTRITLINTRGMIVLDKYFRNQLSLDVSGLLPGVYIVHLTGDKYTVTRRIGIIRP